MIALLIFLLRLLLLPSRPELRLEAENAALRQQLIILQRKVRGCVQLTNSDRLFFVQLYRWFPSILKTMTVVKPETLLRWHRAGFRRYWRWKSRNHGGRPPIAAELRALIRRMSLENRLWGAPHIHGELLKLGFTVAQSTVAKYMANKGDDPCGQSWSTFLRNHMPHIAAMDLFVVPTIGFRLLYALVIVRLARRELVWINVTAHPTAEWIAQQMVGGLHHQYVRNLSFRYAQDRALRVSPIDRLAYIPYHAMAIGHFSRGRYKEAATSVRRAVQSNPSLSVTQSWLVAILAKLAERMRPKPPPNRCWRCSRPSAQANSVPLLAPHRR